MSEFLWEWLPLILAMLATGACAGILAGLLGVGGGIVIVPVLYFVLQTLGISPASASADVWRRGPSSVSTFTTPAIVATSMGTISSLKRPASIAASAR